VVGGNPLLEAVESANGNKKNKTRIGQNPPKWPIPNTKSSFFFKIKTEAQSFSKLNTSVLYKGEAI